MAPADYERLRRMAENEGLSVAEMVRRAVDERYMVAMEKGKRLKALDKIKSLPPINLPDWPEMKKELADRRGALLP